MVQQGRKERSRHAITDADVNTLWPADWPMSGRKEASTSNDRYEPKMHLVCLSHACMHVVRNFVWCIPALYIRKYEPLLILFFAGAMLTARLRLRQ